MNLTFFLTHRLTVRSVEFRGEELPRAQLKRGVEALRPGAFFSEEKLARATDELRDALAREGYFEAPVETSVERDLEASTAAVFFDVGRGRRYAISGISFEGPTVVPESDLLRRLRDKPGVTVCSRRASGKTWTSSGSITLSLGYRQAEIDPGREDFDEAAGRVALTVNVRPGEKITFLIRGADVPASVLASSGRSGSSRNGDWPKGRAAS